VPRLHFIPRVCRGEKVTKHRRRWRVRLVTNTANDVKQWIFIYGIKDGKRNARKGGGRRYKQTLGVIRASVIKCACWEFYVFSIIQYGTSYIVANIFINSVWRELCYSIFYSRLWIYWTLWLLDDILHIRDVIINIKHCFFLKIRH